MKKSNQLYVDVTKKWLESANFSIKKLVNSTYVEKNNKKYFVNNVNKIEFLNREKENAEWFINKFGGVIEFLPTIQEDGGIACADYKYHPNHNNCYFLEEKETNGKGKNVFYHALEGKEKQSSIFLIDCTDSRLTDIEIYERIDKIFEYKETQYVKIVIIKNNSDLFGVYQKAKNKKRSGTP